MEMKDISSEVNVAKLCDCIINALDNKNNSEDDLTTCIRGLKFICYGLKEETCLSRLTPQEKLSTILKTDNLAYAIQPEDCINTVESLLRHSHLSLDLCTTLKILLPIALKINTNWKFTIIDKLFSHNDFPMLPVDLIEEVLSLDTKQLELHIVGLYSEQCNKESRENQMWSSDRDKHWVCWCSKSPKLFCILTSLMNQMLLIVKNRKAILDIIINFVTNVFHVCQQESLDFSRLYPIKLQSLVNLMSLNIEHLPDQYVDKMRVYFCEQINVLKKENLTQALLLLTHFNKLEYFIT